MGYHRVKVFINPVAGSRLGARAARILATEAATYADPIVTVSETRRENFLDEVLAAAREHDLIVLGGGDSTARVLVEAAVRLAGSGTDFALIPLGLENDFARQFCRPPGSRHIERRLPAAFRDLLAGRVSRVACETLCVNGQHHLASTFAMGFDADVSCAYHRFRDTFLGRLLLRSRVLGESAYVFISLVMFLRRRDFRELRLLSVDPGGGAGQNLPMPRHILSVQVTTSAFYGGARISNHARPDDGIFEVTINPGVLSLAAIFANKLSPRFCSLLDRHLRQHRVRALEIHLPAGQFHFHGDGEDFTDRLAGQRLLRFEPGGHGEVLVVGG